MSILEQIFKPKPKQEVPRPHTQEEREAESRIRSEEIRAGALQEDKERMAVAEAKFRREKPELELRLVQIPGQIKDLERQLDEMQGREMRKILDKEHELNSVLSPIDSTDTRRQREYEEWQRALLDSRRAVQELKASLQGRIDKKKEEIYKLQDEKREIESRMQRGY